MWATLDIAIGLVTVFLLVSIVVSGVNEWLAHWFERRGKFLRLGLQRLIGDEAIYRRLLNHPLVASLYREGTASGQPPSYLSPETFALAIADVLLTRANSSRAAAAPLRPLSLSVASLRAAMQSPALAGSPAAATLLPILDRAGDDLDAAMKGIQAWFNDGMDRVSGWYKARTRVMLFSIGFALAASCNIDAIEIASALNRSPELRASWVALGQQTAQSGTIGGVKIAELKDRAPTEPEWKSLRPVLESVATDKGERLPIGYQCLGQVMSALPPAASAPGAVDTAKDRAASAPPQGWSACGAAWSAAVANGLPANAPLKLLGWLITAMSSTMGAGFWFNLLTKAINIRGAGPKPLVTAAGAAK